MAGTIFALGVAAYLLSGLLSRWPGLVEGLFVRGWAAHVAPPFSRLVGAVPVPAAEFLAAGYLGLRTWTVAGGVRTVAAGRRKAGVALRSGLAVGLRDAGLALLLFYVLWGFHYARTPASSRLGLPAVEEPTTAELLRLSHELGTVANASYRILHGSEDAGRPTEMPEEWEDLHSALHRGWLRVGELLPGSPLLAARYGPPKALLSSPLAAHLGITGFYSPFTAEPLVVGTTPAVVLALSLAHEQAHQRGVTDEGEATFLGYLAAVGSGDPLLRYSAAVRARSRILRALARQDTAAARRAVEEWVPGIRRDLEDLQAFRRRHRGAAARVTTRVNDAYLRANRVPGGVESYDRVTLLLVGFARQRGGSVVPHGPGSSAD